MIKISKDLSKDIYWTGGHYYTGRIEVTGIREMTVDSLAIHIVDNNSGSTLTSCSVSQLDNWRREGSRDDPSFNNGSANHGVSISWEYEPTTNTFYIALSFRYISDSSNPGVIDMFSNGDFSFNIALVKSGEEEQHLIQSVVMKDMSQAAIDARRTRKESKHTVIKFWLSIIGIPVKTFGYWFALSLACQRFPEIVELYPFLNYLIHPSKLIMTLASLGLVGYIVHRIVSAPEELKKMQEKLNVK